MSANFTRTGFKSEKIQDVLDLHLNKKSANQSKFKHRINQQMRVNFMWNLSLKFGFCVVWNLPFKFDFAVLNLRRKNKKHQKFARLSCKIRANSRTRFLKSKISTQIRANIFINFQIIALCLAVNLAINLVSTQKLNF